MGNPGSAGLCRCLIGPEDGEVVRRRRIAIVLLASRIEQQAVFALLDLGLPAGRRITLFEHRMGGVVRRGRLGFLVERIAEVTFARGLEAAVSGQRAVLLSGRIARLEVHGAAVAEVEGPDGGAAPFLGRGVGGGQGDGRDN